MAIEVNRYGTTPQTTTPAAATGAGTTSATSKPIDFNNKNEKNSETQIDSAIINYVNSEEFKSLSPEQQVKQVKEKFFPTATVDQVKSYITTAKQQASSTQLTTSTSQTEATEVNGSTQTSSTPATTTPRTEVKQNEIEIAADKYIEKTGFKGTIDDLKAALLSKKNNGTLNPEEKQLLETIQSNISKTAGKDNQGKPGEFETLLPMKTLVSNEFLKKTPEEKLSDITNAYLIKNDKEYAALSDEEKKQYLNQQMESITSALNPERKPLSEAQAKAKVLDAIVLLQKANDEGKPVQEYLNMNADELKQAISNSKKEYTQKLLNSIPKEALEGKSPAEKVMTYADVILSMGDDKYNSLSGAEKERYLQDKCNSFIEECFDIKNWSEYAKENPKIAENMIQYSSTIMCMLSEKGKSFEDYKNLTTFEQTQLTLEYLKQNPNPKTKKIEQELSTKLGIMRTLQDAGINNPKEKDIHTYLKQQKQLGKLSPTEEYILKKYEAEKDLKVNNNRAATLNNNSIEAAKQGQTTEDYIKTRMQYIDYDNKEQLKKQVDKLVAGSTSIEELKLITEMLSVNGVSEKEIRQLIPDPEDTISRYNARALADNNGTELTKIKTTAERLAGVVGKAAKLAVQRAAEVSAKYLDNRELTVYGEEAVGDELVAASFTKGLNNREYITKENAAEVSTNILRSENVANAHKATFTQNMIIESKNNGPEEQLYFAEQYSKIENQAVTEGLAAATKYVDESVQSQYNTYVNNAVNNYPPEQQTQIRNTIETARQTGTISQETLSQTTPPAVSNTRDSNTGSANSSKPTANSATNTKSNTITGSNKPATRGSTQTPAAASSTPAPVRKTSTTSTPTVAKSSPATQSVKTPASQNVSNIQTSKELEAKKEMLIERFVKFEEKKAENIQERNEVQENKNNDSVSSNSSTGTTNETDNSADTLEELTFSKGEENALKEIFNSGGITALYEALIQKTGNGTHEIFFEKLVQLGKPSDVLSFANSYKDAPDIILNLINYCSNKEMKFDLLKLLPNDSIREMVNTQSISEIDFEKLVRSGKVESNTIIEYLNKNKGSMSIDEMKKYSQFLSLDDRNILSGLITQKMGVTKGSDEWLRQQRESMRTSTSSNPQLASNIPTFDDALEIGSTKVPMARGYDKMKKTGHTYIG